MPRPLDGFHAVISPWTRRSAAPGTTGSSPAPCRAGAFLAADVFLAGAFFVAVFLAADFLAGAFFVADFFAGAFLAGVFLAADFFFAGVFLAADFLAAGRVLRAGAMCRA